MEHLRGVVERITYQNEENGYTVLKCRVKGYRELVAVVGTMPEPHVGSVLMLGGSWKVDGKYGRQFAVETYEETLPATAYGIEKYLGSGLIKGIGPKYAKKIVQFFGADTLEIIETDPDRLIEVEGIGRVRVDRIKAGWSEQKAIKNIMIFLQDHGVSTSHATKIFKTYGDDSIRVVQENPYRLADDIRGIGFRTADIIAGKMGFGEERYARLRSGIFYALNQLSEEGHCYAEKPQLMKTAEELLNVDESLLAMTLDEMVKTSDVIREKIEVSSAGTEQTLPGAPSDSEETETIEAIYLPPFFFAETGTARRMTRLLSSAPAFSAGLTGLKERISMKTGMQYDEIQMEAILAAVTNKIFILTGGPGTGKTTTTLGIITAFRECNARILLAAPTGRAAKRLSEATGMEAKTIHRLLETKPPEGYKRNEENPLEGDVLIVDECSMIDLLLMYNLLKAVPEDMTVVLVGDADQLPSVGAGNVLSDLLRSGVIPSVRLTRIFRQAMGSRIITNAHRINRGEAIDMRGGRDSDFFFADIERLSGNAGDAAAASEAAADLVVRYCTRNLPQYYRVSPVRDIQVLTPMQRGAAGAVNLNRKLQAELNPTKICLMRSGVEFRLNDKVMQIRNDYDKDIFNGDIGFITRVDTEERELTVNFDGREVTYDISELDELVLAYATTVHKAQGAEFPIVVMPVLMSHYVMLQRNLLYTGVTRAKRILVLIGQKRAVRLAVMNNAAVARNTRLAERLQVLREKNRQAKGTRGHIP